MWPAQFFGNLTRYNDNELIWQHIHRIKICMVLKEKLLLASWPAGQTLNELLLIMLWAQLIRSPWVLDVRAAVVPFFRSDLLPKRKLKIWIWKWLYFLLNVVSRGWKSVEIVRGMCLSSVHFWYRWIWHRIQTMHIQSDKSFIFKKATEACKYLRSFEINIWDKLKWISPMHYSLTYNFYDYFYPSDGHSARCSAQYRKLSALPESWSVPRGFQDFMRQWNMGIVNGKRAIQKLGIV